jgi:general secretion pathway protein A
VVNSPDITPANAVSAAKVIPVLPDLGTSFNDASSNEATAYRELAQLWGTTLAEGDPCQVAKAKELRCYKGSGGLAEIRQLDRPAMLLLRDDANKTHFALLTGLTNTGATLQIGGTSYSVSLITLGRRIHRDFVTFWRAPQEFREAVTAGDHGPDVDWLALQLAKLNGSKEPESGRPVDPVLIKQVREFQFVQGLEVDGIVGPKTFMHLNNAAGIPEPHLQNSVAIANPPSEK